MKINILKGSLFLLCIFLSCKTIAQSKVKDTLVDPVTGQKVVKSESYDWYYAGKKYYFSSYDSRASFKMNPQKFLLNQCTADMTTTDLVTGVKVNKAESYDLKYNGQKYYFESYESKETFKMNPEKFIKNKCAPQDSVK
jgi:YHS domain-containing protein